jgi:hypothetical protein
MENKKYDFHIVFVFKGSVSEALSSRFQETKGDVIEKTIEKIKEWIRAYEEKIYEAILYTGPYIGDLVMLWKILDDNLIVCGDCLYELDYLS